MAQVQDSEAVTAICVDFHYAGYAFMQAEMRGKQFFKGRGGDNRFQLMKHLYTTMVSAHLGRISDIFRMTESRDRMGR